VEETNQWQARFPVSQAAVKSQPGSGQYWRPLSKLLYGHHSHIIKRGVILRLFQNVTSFKHETPRAYSTHAGAIMP